MASSATPTASKYWSETRVGAAGSLPRRGFAAVVATLTAAAALSLAADHFISPGVAVAATLIWIVVSAAWPGLGWTVVPALLPALDLSPWTGALIFDEFDLLLLATIAGGWLRLAWDAPRVGPDVAGPGRLVLFLGVSAAAGLARGLLDADGPWFGASQGYIDPLNSVRITKSFAFAVLFAPLIRHGLASDRDRALRALCVGVWCGMGIVALSVVAERTAFPGLLDFSRPYRTTALFWEMHVGGAAIDVYAALGASFVAWAVWSSRSPAGRIASALLTLSWCYVCLTTFSRGVWLAVLVSLGGLAFVVWRARVQREVRWRRAGDVLLLVALLAEIGVVAATGSFMGERLAASEQDLSSRLTHWRDGVGLLHTPADWALGLGSGRLPARYAAEVRHGEFPGSVHVPAARTGEKTSYATLAGPRSVPSLGGLFSLTQRVPLQHGARFQAEFDLRARTDVELLVRVCEMHLLFARRCEQAAVLARASATGDWLHLRLPLSGPPLDPGRWFAPRSGVLMFSVANVGGAVDLGDVVLRMPGGPSLTRNPRFEDGLDGWYPLAQRYFLPWHVDNFVLETLIERGITGLAASTALVGFALVSVLSRPRAGDVAFAPFLGAAIVAVLLVGAVSSVADMPRVAFAFWGLAILAAQLRAAQLSTTALAASAGGAPVPVPTSPAAISTAIVPPPHHAPNADPS